MTSRGDLLGGGFPGFFFDSRHLVRNCFPSNGGTINFVTSALLPKFGSQSNTTCDCWHKYSRDAEVNKLWAGKKLPKVTICQMLHILFSVLVYILIKTMKIIKIMDMKNIAVVESRENARIFKIFNRDVMM